MRFTTLLTVLLGASLAAREETVPTTLPPQATTELDRSLASASRHPSHVWRDTPPLNTDGTLNGYVEISRGDRRTWGFDMGANRRALGRTLPAGIGSYPVNYGFVPQTVSYDGDPFDVLVLGPAIDGGRVVRGAIVGVLRMHDEKRVDSKVVISPPAEDGRPVYALTDSERQRIGSYFDPDKAHESGRFSRIVGWGDVAEALSYVSTTHAFYETCRDHADSSCTLAISPSTR